MQAQSRLALTILLYSFKIPTNKILKFVRTELVLTVGHEKTRPRDLPKSNTRQSNPFINLLDFRFFFVLFHEKRVAIKHLFEFSLHLQMLNWQTELCLVSTWREKKNRFAIKRNDFAEYLYG